jgi:hypothetical protein
LAGKTSSILACASSGLNLYLIGSSVLAPFLGGGGAAAGAAAAAFLGAGG